MRDPREYSGILQKLLACADCCRFLQISSGSCKDSHGFLQRLQGSHEILNNIKFPGTWQGPEVPCEIPWDLLGRIWIRTMNDKSYDPIAGLQWSLWFSPGIYHCSFHKVFLLIWSSNLPANRLNVSYFSHIVDVNVLGSSSGSWDMKT